MSSRLERQRARDQEAILTAAVKIVDHRRRQKQMAALDAAKGPGTSLLGLAAAWDAKQRQLAPWPAVAEEQTAAFQRQIETIVSAEHTNPETGEVYTVDGGERVISLVDAMAKELPADFSQAADQFRELFFEAIGQSKGVSSYGDYVAGAPAWSRLNTTHRQMTAYDRLKLAAIAAFGVVDKERKITWDVELMQQIIPAILSDKKEITQGAIGRALTNYTGAKQTPAAGGAFVQSVLRRLAIHFRLREK